MVRVHHFSVWDHLAGKTVIQPLKSTEERITDIGGTIVPGTAQEVDAAALDSHGRYTPTEKA